MSRARPGKAVILSERVRERVEGSPPEPERLLDRMRSAIRVHHYSIRTEEAYLSWVRRFISFHRAHPCDLEADEINGFLTHLAVHDHVAASTQRHRISHLVESPAPIENPNGPRPRKRFRSTLVFRRLRAVRLFIR